MLRYRLGMGLALLFLVVPGWAGPVNFTALVNEMTDLEILSRLPDPAYTCRQFSSYDQRSTDPAVLTDENWFANGDRGQYLRAEERNGEKEYVLMDAAGPGAIVRFWSANPADAGIVRIYLDAAPDPAIELPLEDYLGGKFPLAPDPIAGERSKGWNNYLPIPYARQCKVTTSKPDFYYHINYRTYAAGTVVESFDPAAAAQQIDAVNTVAAALSDPAHPTPEGTDTDIRAEVPAGGTREIELKGPAAIRAITLSIDAPDNAEALRNIVLEIAFDEQAPTVVAPLGDFFGTAPGINAYASLPSGVIDGSTLYAHWVMPFQKSATLSLRNHGKAGAMVVLKATTAPYEWDAHSLYFHAKWRGELQIPTQPRQDWNYVDVQGKGRFVGVSLHIANPVRDWWGEGDEKIYVDGEKFPSHFGTGSEDYFGYAWCFPEPFTHAYHNQPRCDGPGNYGHTNVNRFHILDNIPFTSAFRFDMEVWHWANTHVDQFAMAYWYATAASTDNTPPIDPALLHVPQIPDLPEIPHVKGALEGEKLKIREVTGGATQIQAGITGWSGGEQLWWIDAAPGAALTLEIKAPKAGDYEIRGVFTKAADYGIVRFGVNDKPLGEAFDGYNNGVIATPEITLGTAPLRKGANTFQVTIEGMNPAGDPRHMFGLDYLLLKPLP